ncbi:hypothetical protein DWG18_02490 [Lysobacter sp. TY2-98]|uniref:hypothetical protein n=1 Tax=Lysobacter sp. TY2-98 TaxID=2290922 RepID=UPI000E1FFF21|nr:hypothetical protein [Lysobacter sp. TY2-98]AXK71268.1 hypothetical protein DWG18_02490 [Lysobacter sp. TY2-98]
MDSSWTAQLLNLTVEAVEQWEALPCVLRLSGGYRIQVESLWRLLSDDCLVLTSGDEGQLFGRASPVRAIPELAAALVGKPVSSLLASAGTRDLTVVLGNLTFQVIADSSGYEAWQIEGPAGFLAVG